MKIPEGAKQDLYEETWIYEVDGVKKNYTTEESPWDIPNAKFIDRKSKLIEKGFEPSITDFIIEDENEYDITDSILNLDRVYLVLSSEMEKAEKEGIEEVNIWYKKNKDKKVIFITSTIGEKLEKFKNKYRLDIPICFLDGKVIKTIIRSNPGVIMIENGVISDKKNWRDINDIK